MKTLYLPLLGMFLFCLGSTNIQAQNQRKAKKVTTWNGNFWSHGTPTLETKAIFTANLTTTENLLADEIEVKDGVQLKIDGNATLIVTNDMKVAPTAKLSIMANAQLVHKNPNSLPASVDIYRKTRPVNKFDYTYFCSPVQGQILNQITDPDFIANTPGFLPPLSDKYLRYFGGWIYVPETDIMGDPASGTGIGAGTGYIIRGPQSFTAPQVWQTKFIGEPNNGNISVALATGTAYTACTSDIYSPNLIGNPYPSAIDADTFLTNPTNVANLGGALYFWTHNTGLNPPGVLDYTINDYVVYNLLGGIGTGKVQNDLIYAPSGYNRPTGKIASCQSFFVNGSGTAAFNNDMFDTTILPENQQFYRHSNATSMIPPISKSRIWLSLSSSSTYKEILVGYVPNTPNVPLATNGYEKAYDTNVYSTVTSTNFYSNINMSSSCPKLVIQGRALGASFNTDDVIPLGFSGSAGTAYTIKAETFDGLFGSQMFWLKETVGTTITYRDIRTAGYTFTPTVTVTDDTTRFQIVFKSNAYTTQLNAIHCGTTLTDLNDSLYCGQIAGATGYVFEVTEVANPSNVRTITRNVNSFSMQMLSGTTTLSTQYSVRVSPIVNGFSQGFGLACTITTQGLPPTTKIAPAYCNTSSSSVWYTHYIQQVNGIGGVIPTRYRVEVVNNSATPIITSYLDLVWPSSSFQLKSAPFLPTITGSVGTTYTIRVAYEWNGSWQAYGLPCNYTTLVALPRYSQSSVSIFEANAYPNPFTNNFKIDLNTSGEEKVSIKAYDMLGRMVETREAKIADFDSQEIGSQFASGIYNIIIAQGENVKTIRVIKR